MRLMKAVDVDDSRVEALTPEAFRLVLEARGWWHPWLDDYRVERDEDTWVGHGVGLMLSDGAFEALVALADAHHNGSTFDAFVEVERVQALLSAVEAAERGEWSPHKGDGTPKVMGRVPADWRAPNPSVVCIWASGHVTDSVSTNLWPWKRDYLDPERAAREARAQLPRLVRIICGVEG